MQGNAFQGNIMHNNRKIITVSAIKYKTNFENFWILFLDEEIKFNIPRTSQFLPVKLEGQLQV